jgi:hypothetical protein
MLKNLVKIASDLDAAGFKKEADIVDLIIRKVAASIEDSSQEDENLEDNIPSGFASSSDLDELLQSEVSDEEKRFYEDLQRRVLEEEEEEEFPSDEDIQEFYSRK